MQSPIDISNLQHIAQTSFYETLENVVRGAITVDINANIVWINQSYLDFLGYDNEQEVLNKHILEIIPGSLIPQVLATEKPILLDLLEYQNGWTAVSRFPLKDENDQLIGAFGFLLFDSVASIEPMFNKVKMLKSDLDKAHHKLKNQRLAKYSLNHFIGISDAIIAIKKQARLAANSHASMIISGETGTGKELIAQAIHALSARSRQKFVAVNVAAIPQDLVEVEFFGAVAGAYTGVSKTGRIGKMELANGGTLFLDEVADMPMSVQSKLLRALQEREVEPVGSNNIVAIDIRVIAATSLNLEQLVAEGKFRADLYYRLNVIPIKIPPLRARLTDIDVLCESILEDFSKDEHSPKFISDEAITILKQHQWPGNVRELKNVLQRVSAMNTNSTIDKADILDILASVIDKPLLTNVATQLSNDSDTNMSEEIAAASTSLTTATTSSITTPLTTTTAITTTTSPIATAPLSTHAQQHSLSTLVAQYEKQVILSALEQASNNKSIAAQTLGIPRSSFYVKLKQYGIS